MTGRLSKLSNPHLSHDFINSCCPDHPGIVMAMLMLMVAPYAGQQASC